jgi:hypothetical protein
MRSLVRLKDAGTEYAEVDLADGLAATGERTDTNRRPCRLYGVTPSLYGLLP